MYIYYISLGLSVFFLFIGLFVTESNARYLLAGYNTMNDAERSLFDISGYINNFRKFHIILAISFLLASWSLHYVFGDSVSGFFLIVYPILSYIYFLFNSQKFQIGDQSKSAARAGIWILITIVTLVFGYMLWGIQPTKADFNDTSVMFSGSYGQTIHYTEIVSTELLSQLPVLNGKTNGYVVGPIRKGHFKASDKSRMLLLADVREDHYIKIVRKDKPPVYVSSPEIDEEVLFKIILGKILKD